MKEGLVKRSAAFLPIGMAPDVRAPNVVMATAGASSVADIISGLLSKTIHPDGTVTTAPVSGDVFYWNGVRTPGNEVYRLLVGENFHAVSSCGLADFNAIVQDRSIYPRNSSNR